MEKLPFLQAIYLQCRACISYGSHCFPGNVFQKAFFFTKYLCLSSSTYINWINNILFISKVTFVVTSVFCSVIIEKMWLFLLVYINSNYVHFWQLSFLVCIPSFFKDFLAFFIIWRIILSRTKKCWIFTNGTESFFKWHLYLHLLSISFTRNFFNWCRTTFTTVRSLIRPCKLNCTKVESKAKALSFLSLVILLMGSVCISF